MSARVVISRDGAIERELRLENEVTVVGRHASCDVVLADPAVSLRHLLLRVIDRAVYAEDLESTNGVRVNDLRIFRHVLHHLDVIRVGNHKIHFFDEALMVGAVGNLDSTVHTEYEATMVARSPQPAPWKGGDAENDDATVPVDYAERSARDAISSAFHPARLGLRRLAGGRPAELVPLELAHTMIGEDEDQALVVRRHDELFLTKVSRKKPLLINEREMGPGSHPIAMNDVIDVGALRFVVVALDG
jgi:predicted component of type VI protein secretion system